VQVTADTCVVVAVQVLVGGRAARELLLHHRHQLLQDLVHLVAREQIRHLHQHSVVYREVNSSGPDLTKPFIFYFSLIIDAYDLVVAHC